MSKTINWDRLKDFFDESDIEWKPIAFTKDKSKALAAAYITARAIQDRLDEVFGVAGWKNEYREGPCGGIICRIYFRDDSGKWCYREDGAENTEIEAIKGGISASLKRTGSALGIGRYLYKLPAQWIPVDKFKKFKYPPQVPPNFLPESKTRDAERKKLHKTFFAVLGSWCELRNELAGEDRFDSNTIYPRLINEYLREITGNADEPSDSINDLSDDQLEDLVDRMRGKVKALHPPVEEEEADEYRA